MTKKLPTSTALLVSLATGTVLSVMLTGCVAPGHRQSRGPGPSPGYVRSTVVYQDDYDYYPGYEIYYGRNRHEYIYHDGRSWVRRSEPAEISLNELLAAPSVRSKFHDAPEQHHHSVSNAYPKTWHRPDHPAATKGDGHDEKPNAPKDDERKARRSDDDDGRH